MEKINRTKIVALSGYIVLIILFATVAFIKWPVNPINVAKTNVHDIEVQNNKWFILNSDDYELLDSAFGNQYLNSSDYLTDGQRAYYYNIKVKNDKEDYIITVRTYGEKAQKLDNGEKITITGMASKIPDDIKSNRENSLSLYDSYKILDFCINDNLIEAPSSYVASIIFGCLSLVGLLCFIYVLKYYKTKVVK